MKKVLTKFNKNGLINITKIFLKNITIKDRKSAENFIKALENVENKKAKKVTFDKRTEDVTDSEEIRKLLSN